MEKYWFCLRKRKDNFPKNNKVNLIPVHSNSFEDLTLTQEYLKFIEDRIKFSSDLLIRGAWEDEGQAKDLVGYLRACEELKEKYKHLYKSLYSR